MARNLGMKLDFVIKSATLDNMAKSNNKSGGNDMAKRTSSGKVNQAWTSMHNEDGDFHVGPGFHDVAGGGMTTPEVCTHGTIKQVPLPKRVKGALFGAAGSKLKQADFNSNNITMFVPMAGIAFGTAEDFDGFVFGCPMQDFGCWSTARLVSRAKFIAGRVLEGHRVCIACHGGHGRTGTLLAAVVLCLRVRAAQSDAVSWIRTVFCARAIETDLQEQRVAEVAAVVRAEVKRG